MHRHQFLAASAATLGLGALAARPASAATAVTTQLQWIKDSQNAGWWIADADGYFKAEGIESVVLAGGPNVSSIEAIVAAGKADIAIDNLERILDANNAGTDFVVFGALYQRNPSALMSLPAHPIHTAKDLIGKRIGLQQGAKVFIDAIMKLNHLPPDYSEVVVGSTPDPLLQGACDAYLCFVTNQPLQLAARGIPSVTATFDQLGYSTYQDALFCTREYFTKNHATLVKFARALRRGWETSERDPAQGAKLAVSTYGVALGLNEAKELATAKAQNPLLVSDDTRTHGMLWVDKKRVAGPIYATLRATGRTTLPPVDRFIDNSVLIEAARPS